MPPYRILLVEDEDADILHFQRLCRKLDVGAEIVVAKTGKAALAVLKSATTNALTIVVTDLNLPGMTGHELIDEIRSDEAIAKNVIFVLSTSDVPSDIERAYTRQVAGYMVKDTLGKRLEDGINLLKRYLNTVVLP